MNDEQKKQAEKDNMKILLSEIGMYGAKLKRTGSGGYLGHGKSGGVPDYKPGEDAQYKVSPK